MQNKLASTIIYDNEIVSILCPLLLPSLESPAQPPDHAIIRIVKCQRLTLGSLAVLILSQYAAIIPMVNALVMGYAMKYNKSIFILARARVRVGRYQCVQIIVMVAKISTKATQRAMQVINHYAVVVTTLAVVILSRSTPPALP